MDDSKIRATTKRVFQIIEDLAGDNPNRPIGDLWFALREDKDYVEAITRWQVFGEE